MEQTLFEDVGDVLRGLIPSELGELHHRAHRYGIKVWFGSEQPTREHYEAQVIGAKHVRDARHLAIEVGFHSEHPEAAQNDATIELLQSSERRWRKAIGKEAVVGPFLGRADVWRRISQTWPDPNLEERELAFELGVRLTDYVTALESLRRRA
ncbi:MAG: hypothetical protein ACT4OX_15120 [Actinomycetota bacterium]